MFSIIIPVFNVEKYLAECIESILIQEFTNYEIILVNDGSTDDSGKLCDSYDLRYDFIKVIHKENGGLSDARNIGLKHVSGEYVLFVDSDDYIAPGSLQGVYNTLMEDDSVDVIFLNATKFYSNEFCIPMNDGYDKNQIYQKQHLEVLNHLTNLPKFPGSACTKLIKKKLIYDHNLYFKQGLLSEDIDWTMELLLVAHRYNYYDKDYYFYRQNREGSITHSVNYKNVESLLYIIKKWGDIPAKYSGYTSYILQFLSYEYMITLYLYGGLSRKYRAMYARDMKRYVWLLSKSKNSKSTFTNIVYTVFGLSLSSKLLYKYQEAKMKHTQGGKRNAVIHR